MLEMCSDLLAVVVVEVDCLEEVEVKVQEVCLVEELHLLDQDYLEDHLVETVCLEAIHLHLAEGVDYSEVHPHHLEVLFLQIKTSNSHHHCLVVVQVIRINLFLDQQQLQLLLFLEQEQIPLLAEYLEVLILLLQGLLYLEEVAPLLLISLNPVLQYLGPKVLLDLLLQPLPSDLQDPIILHYLDQILLQQLLLCLDHPHKLSLHLHHYLDLQ